MKKLLILLLALLAIAAIAYFCAYKTRAPAIEADIAARTKAVLENNGISSIDVAVDGRDITLTGAVPSVTQKQSAEQLAKVDGANFINNLISVFGDENPFLTKAPQGHSLTVNLDDSGVITLDGILDPASHKSLKAASIERYGEDKVQDRILELDIPVAEGMPDIVIHAVQKMSGLTSGRATLTGNKLKIVGNSPSKVMLEQVGLQLKDKLPKGYRVDLDLNVAHMSEQKEQVAKQLSRRQCQREFNKILKTRVQFNSSSSVLKKSSYRVLNRLADTAKQCANMKIKVHGHTDSTGRNSVNRRISKERAQSVVNYLVKKGIPREHLQSIGYGSSKPIASNKTSRGRARNRRIELTVESIR